MTISSKIFALYSIEDEEDSFNAVKEILKELKKENVILSISERFEDEENAEIFGSGCFDIDLSKIDNLFSSWRYIKEIFFQILKGLDSGALEIVYHTSHKYSFLDTLFDTEIESVKPDTIEDKEVIGVDGILNY